MSGWDQQGDIEDFDDQVQRMINCTCRVVGHMPDGSALHELNPECPEHKELNVKNIVFPPVRVDVACFCTICAWELEAVAFIDPDDPEQWSLDEAASYWQDAHDERGACKAEISYTELARSSTKGGEDGNEEDSDEEDGGEAKG